MNIKIDVIVTFKEYQKKTTRNSGVNTRTSLRTGGAIRSSGKVSSYCSTCYSCYKPGVSHDWGKDCDYDQ